VGARYVTRTVPGREDCAQPRTEAQSRSWNSRLRWSEVQRELTAIDSDGEGRALGSGMCGADFCLLMEKSTTSDKNSSGDEIANVNFYAVRPEATQIR